ncbi:MAG: pPPM1a [Bacilli bacterium]|nr:pPPM1a [Bacilli bacterium]
MNPLENIMGVSKAAKMWGLAPGTIKNYCAEGRIKAVKLDGKFPWVIDINQPNPSKPNHPMNWRGKADHLKQNKIELQEDGCTFVDELDDAETLKIWVIENIKEKPITGGKVKGVAIKHKLDEVENRVRKFVVIH